MKNKIYINSPTFKYVITVIRDLEKFKKEKAEIEKSIIEESPEPPDGLPRGNQTSDSTATKVIKIINNERYNWLDNTIKVLEDIYSKIDKDKKTIWNRVIVKNEKPYIIDYDVGMSARTIYLYRRQIVIMVAKKLGII